MNDNFERSGERTIEGRANRSTRRNPSTIGTTLLEVNIHRPDWESNPGPSDIGDTLAWSERASCTPLMFQPIKQQDINLFYQYVTAHKN